MMKKQIVILLFSFVIFFSMFSYGNGLWTDLLQLEGGTVIRFQFEITDDIHSEEPAVQMIPTELPDQGAPAVLPEIGTKEEENGASTEHATPVTDTNAATNASPDQENDQEHDQNNNTVSDADSHSDANSGKNTDTGTDTDSDSDAGNGFNE